MLNKRYKMIDVVIEVEGLPSEIEEKAKMILRKLQDSREISALHPFLRKHEEYQCSFCKSIDEKKSEFFDADGLPNCCDEALVEAINSNESLKQIITDPENQPNQYGIGLCPCGKIYEQAIPVLFKSRSCESCLDARSYNPQRRERVK